MKEPYEKGEAIHSAPGFAVDIARCAAKGKQGHRWAGYCASKNCHRNANAVVKAEGRRNRTGIATSGTVPRSRQEQTDAAPTFVILSGLIGMEELIARSLENKTITLMETSCSGTRDSPGSGAGPCAGPGARMGVGPPGRRTRLPDVRSHGRNNIDLSFFNTNQITETIRLQFRAEAFNAFNRPEWSSPVGDFGTANFGRVTAFSFNVRFQASCGPNTPVAKEAATASYRDKKLCFPRRSDIFYPA